MDKIIEKLLASWDINAEIKQIYDSAWSFGNNYVINANNEDELLAQGVAALYYFVDENQKKFNLL